MVCSYCEMIWRKLQSNYMGEEGYFIFVKCRWSEIRKLMWSLASVTLCKFAHYVRREREVLNQKEQFESFLFPNKSSSHGLFENFVSQISHCKPSSSGRGGTRKNWKKVSFPNKSSACQSYSCLKTPFPKHHISCPAEVEPTRTVSTIYCGPPLTMHRNHTLQLT